MLIANLPIAVPTSEDLWCAQSHLSGSHPAFPRHLTHKSRRGEGRLGSPCSGKLLPPPLLTPGFAAVVAAATDSRTGEAIDSSTASSPGVAYADDRKKEKERQKGREDRERKRDSESENLHPCGGQAEGATVFTSTDWSEFSPLLAVVFLFILDLRDLGIVAVCVCACVCVCVCVCSCFDFIWGRVGKSNEQFSFRHLH